MLNVAAFLGRVGAEAPDLLDEVEQHFAGIIDAEGTAAADHEAAQLLGGGPGRRGHIFDPAAGTFEERKAPDVEPWRLVERAPARHRRRARAADFKSESPGVVPSDGMPWLAALHSDCTPRLLTQDDPRHFATPPGFIGELYPPQQTLLAAMLALEQAPAVRVAEGGGPANAGAIKTLQTRAARLASVFSSGKTVIALALVCAAATPLATPMGVARVPACGGGGGFIPEILLRASRYVPTTLVAAAASVITQWESHAQRFTRLRCFTIENVHSLRKFEAMFREGRVFDLVFLKAGRVTSAFRCEGEPPPNPSAKNRSIFGALARVLEGLPVARLIVDDFDTLKLNVDDCHIPALFTWYISSTRRRAAVPARPGPPALLVADFFRTLLPEKTPILGASMDDTINSTLRLDCDPDYMAAHLNTTAIVWRRIFVRGGRAAAILRDLDVTAEVLELVNADAAGAAAQALGVEARSIGEVINRVVGQQLGRLRHATRVALRASQARGALAPLAPLAPNATARDASELCADLRGRDEAAALAAIDALAAIGPAALPAIASLEEWAAAEQARHSKALFRMRDNIREGSCQCCMLPMGRQAGSPEPVYILAGCCQIVVCEPCITRSRPDHRDRREFLPRCPNCARDLPARALASHLIRVGIELDLEAALSEEGFARIAEGGEAGEAEGGDAGDVKDDDARGGDVKDDDARGGDAKDDDARGGDAKGDDAKGDPEGDTPKLTALAQVIRGQQIDCLRAENAPPFIDGLLCGTRSIPRSGGCRPRILVFSVHPEAVRSIIRQFEGSAGVRCAALSGTRAQKDAAVATVRDAPPGVTSVLLVMSPRDCSGLDLPWLSHIVFYHRILDRNVEAQVAARGQRLGRTHDLEIVSLLNEVEALA